MHIRDPAILAQQLDAYRIIIWRSPLILRVHSPQNFQGLIALPLRDEELGALGAEVHAHAADDEGSGVEHAEQPPGTEIVRAEVCREI